eukprot:UN23766
MLTSCCCSCDGAREALFDFFPICLKFLNMIFMKINDTWVPILTLYIPSTIEEITPTYLNRIFENQLEADNNNEITAVRYKRVGSDNGMLGAAFRLRLEFEHESSILPTNCILKLSSSDFETMLIGVFFELNKRETEFYRAVDNDLPLKIPKYYFSKINESIDKSILIIEELNGRFPDGHSSFISYEETVEIIKGFACMHSRYCFGHRTNLYNKCK